MSEKTPRDFNELKDATIKYQEEKYLDELLGDATVRNDEKSRQREEEVREYDAHLQNMDEKREEHFGASSKPFEKMTPYELTYKIAQAKFNGDKTTEQSLYDALLDNIEKQQNDGVNPDRDLFAEYDHRIDEVFQRLHENEQAKNPESKDDEAAIAAAAILDPKNIAELRKDIEDGEGQGEDETPGTGENPPDDEPEIPEDDENTPGTELVPYVPGAPREPIPEDVAERPSWYQRNRERILGGAALLALAGALTWAVLTEGNKDNKRSGSDEKTEQPAKKGGQAKSNEFKTNDSFSHPDRKTGPGFELGDTAPEAIDQLKQNFKHHPVLLAEAVYAYQNGISVDKARANEDNINKMAKSFIVDGHLTAEGQAWATKLGKSLDNGSAHWVTQDEMHHSTWFNSGIEENGAFDKFDINDKAGFNAKKILRITLGNGKVIYLKYDCQNMLWYEDTESQGSSTTTERGSSTVTLDGKVKFNPRGWDNPKNPTKKHTPKGEVKVDHEGTADTGGVRSKGPGEEKPHQDANNQTSDQANEKTGGGSQGSTKPAEGADQGPKPTGGTEQNASGENNSGTVGE